MNLRNGFAGAKQCLLFQQSSMEPILPVGCSIFFAGHRPHFVWSHSPESGSCYIFLLHRGVCFSPAYNTLMRFQLSARELDQAFVGFVTGFNELAFLVIFPMSVFTVSDYCIDQRAYFCKRKMTLFIQVQSLGSRLMLHYGVFMVGFTFILMG